MTTSRRIPRLLTILTTMSMLLLGPVAFGASISAADEPPPDDVATAPLENPVQQLSPAADAVGDPIGEATGQGGPGSTGEEGDHGDEIATGEEGEHGEEGDTGEEGDNGEESAVLVCLATTDPNAPYTAASVMPTAIINGEGRVKKDGPANSPIGVAPTPGWGNIVPNVTHPSGATFGGLNFGEDGRAIWDAGCGPAAPPDDGHEGGGHGGHAKVIVCIATEDSVTPYEVEEWMVQEIINGHGMPQKNGPASDPVEGVFPDAVWGNIIPVVTHPNKKATYDGLNWDEAGQAIWEAGCVYVVPVAPEPAPGPAAAPVDFCPDLDGLQWENYDCNTPQSPAPEATVPAEPAALVTAATAMVPQLVSTPVNAAMPAQVAVPTEQTPPAAVDAGYGPTSAPVSPLWAVLMILAGCLGATGAAHAAGKGSV